MELKDVLAAMGWLGWLAQVIIPKIIDQRFARSGRIGVNEGRARIVCDTTSNEGHIHTIDYHPAISTLPQYADCRRFRLIIDAQLFNDTETQVVFTHFAIDFWGVEGLRLQDLDTPVYVPAETPDGFDVANSIAVPPHAVADIRFQLSIADTFAKLEEAIRDYYGESVVLLNTKSIDGKARSFRLVTRSFAGTHRVSWRAKDKYPIFSHYAQNVKGRNAGRNGQSRVPAVSSESRELV